MLGVSLADLKATEAHRLSELYFAQCKSTRTAVIGREAVAVALICNHSPCSREYAPTVIDLLPCFQLYHVQGASYSCDSAWQV